MELIKGDALEKIKSIKNNSINAVIVDPPYMINTKSDHEGKLNAWADYCNASYWYEAWMRETQRVLKNDGCFWTFLNWRSFVTFQKASCNIGWAMESVLVWDKEWIGPGGSRGLRPSYELVALFAMPSFAIQDRGLYDIQRFPWSSIKPHGHPAEKPVNLLKWLIENSTAKGDIVADWFMGSGTTGEAAISTGRDFIGIEMSDKWMDVAKKRIEAAEKGISEPQIDGQIDFIDLQMDRE